MEDGSSDVRSVYIYNGVDEVPMNVIHVRVHPSVTVIPAEAFKNRRQLEVVELPEGLIRIEDMAFHSCETLKRINIPSTVTEIGNCAFQHCSFKCYEELVIDLPSNLCRLGQRAFQFCQSLQRINIPSGVTAIEQEIFWDCISLKVVSLPEGLESIGVSAFYHCESLVSVNLPSSLKVVGMAAFQSCGVLNEIHMPDTIQRIEEEAFSGCNLQNFRLPPLLTNVDVNIVGYNDSLVSLELPENLEACTARGPTSRPEIVPRLASLRNVTFPSEVEPNVLEDSADLLVAFPDCNGVEALQHRFDDLLIHKICYYQSYHDNESTLQNLKREINPWTSKFPGQLNTTGKQQDCLGMTPLHILACSTKPTIEMYRLLIDKYPEALIMKDKWGDIPLLYSFWCNASTEVVDLLVESYKSLHREYEFDWKGMIQTLAKRNVPLTNIQKLVNTQQSSYPDQKCDMQGLVVELAASDTAAEVERRRQRNNNAPSTSIETFRYLLRISISKRLESLDVNRWFDELENNISSFRDNHEDEEATMNRDRDTQALYDRLATYESIKEGTTIIELVLWKANIDDSRNKRARISEDISYSYRDQSRINCGADIVMRSVLPYLTPKPLARKELNLPERGFTC